jgi:hypothetical protein
MKPQETFRKVFIKSEVDLPKEGKYHFHIIGDSSLRFKDVESASFRQLKRRVNYYLLPIQEQSRSPRNLERDVAIIYKNFLKDNDIKYPSLELNLLHKMYAKIFCEISSQPIQEQPVEMPTDNNIENKPYNVINEIHLPLGETNRLVRWANYMRGYYGFPIYLVGSALNKTMPRDIDVCCIIPDDLFCKRYHIDNIEQHVSKKISGIWNNSHWRWSDDIIKKTYHGWDFTHMNIDFKVISETENKEQGYEGKEKLQLDTRSVRDQITNTKG